MGVLIPDMLLVNINCVFLKFVAGLRRHFLCEGFRVSDRCLPICWCKGVGSTMPFTKHSHVAFTSAKHSFLLKSLNIELTRSIINNVIEHLERRSEGCTAWGAQLLHWPTGRLLICTKTPLFMAERAVGLLQAGFGARSSNCNRFFFVSEKGMIIEIHHIVMWDYVCVCLILSYRTSCCILVPLRHWLPFGFDCFCCRSHRLHLFTSLSRCWCVMGSFPIAENGKQQTCSFHLHHTCLYSCCTSCFHTIWFL